MFTGQLNPLFSAFCFQYPAFSKLKYTSNQPHIHFIIFDDQNGFLVHN